MRIMLALALLSVALAAQGNQAVFLCPGGEQIGVQFQPERTTPRGTRSERAIVEIDGHPRIVLPRAAYASGARFSDGFTTLWNKGDEIVFESGTLTLRGCKAIAQDTAGPEPTATLEGEWHLSELAGKALEAERKPHIQFQPGEQRAGGFGGCNRFSGSYKTDGEKLSFGAIAATFMACPGPMMELEDSFFKALERTAQYRISSGALEFLNPSGETLAKFVRQ